MALTKTQSNRELTIRLEPDGSFAAAYAVRHIEIADDGVVIAERKRHIELTLAQAKAAVAAL